MKRPLPLLLLALIALAVPAAMLRGAEPPDTEMEFVKNLRAKGYPDLALQYLEKLAKNPPEGLANRLPMEFARTRVSLARRKEPTQRGALFAEARKDLDTFLAKNGSSPEAPQARVELARLSAYQGQALLSQAIRLQDDDEPAAKLAARKAEEQFLQAGKDLDAAAKALKDPEQQLEVRFERGKNFLDQAATHPFNATRAKIVKQAQDVLEAVEKVAIDNNRNPILHLTRAWLVKAYQDGEQPDKAAAYVKGVLREKVAEAAPGQQWAWNFRIRNLLNDKQLTYAVVPVYTPKGYFGHMEFPPLAVNKLDNPLKLKLIVREAKAWLKRFPAAHNTPEGFGVRFALAKAHLNEAQLAGKDNPKAPKAAPYYKAAQKELAALAATDNDYAEKASQLELAIRFQQMGEKTAVGKLKDFDDCYLKARYEMFNLQEAGAELAKAGGAGAKALEEERQQHLKTAIAAFQRGLRLADAKTTFAQQAEARYYLAYLYKMAGDPYRSAIVGEDLAKVQPPTKRSAAAAGYALQAYEQIVVATKQPGDRARMRDLAHYILEHHRTTWADEPVTQLARVQLAMAYLQEQKRKEAMDLLEKVAPDYPAYLYTQAQLILTAAAARRDAKDPKDKQAFEQRMLAALAKLPKLPDKADSSTAQMYLAAELQQGNHLYASAFDHASKGATALAAKQYAALDAFQTELHQVYAKHSRQFPDEAQAEFEKALRQLKNLARFGTAQAEYRAGNYDAVLAPRATGAVVEEVRKLGKDGKAIKMKDYREVGEILGLALRADVQKGKINEARGVLDLLRRLTGEDEEGSESAGNVLKALIQELRAQLREYKDKKDTKRLNETVKNFSQFLDDLAKEVGAKSTPDQVLFLAGCYSSLDRHAEAAKLFARMPEPKVDPAKKNLTKAEEKELQEYWFMQVNYGRSLRLAKQFPEARRVLSRILSTPKVPGQFLAAKEDIHLLEDQGIYGTAVTRWSKFKQHPQMQRALKTIGGKDVAEQKRIKELFYDTGYHYAYCMFMYGKNSKVPATKEKWMNKGAQEFVRLESIPDARELVGAKIQELLRSEPLLMAEYSKVSGKVPAGK